MKLALVTLNGVKYSDDAYSIILPTASGEITVLPQHEPLISALIPGVITVRKHREDPDYHLEHFGTYGGVVEITSDEVRVLVDEADKGEDINEAEVRKARDAAVAMIKSAKNQVSLSHAQQLLDRHEVRLHLAELRRRSGRRPK